MQLRPDWGTYIPALMTLEGSFRTNLTDQPDAIRDGKTNVIASVVRDNVGLFTVTFDDGFPIPERLVSKFVDIAPAANTVAKMSKVEIVDGSYSQATRSFQIRAVTVGDVSLAAYADPALGDPDDLSRISFMLRGSVQSVGTDAA